jgi:hypothetical protein
MPKAKLILQKHARANTRSGYRPRTEPLWRVSASGMAQALTREVRVSASKPQWKRLHGWHALLA